MNHGTFDVNDLIQVYSPPSLGSVMPGNQVMLISGGPCMTVCDTDPEGRAICQWMDNDGVLQSYPFPLECLTCYGAKLRGNSR